MIWLLPEWPAEWECWQKLWRYSAGQKLFSPAVEQLTQCAAAMWRSTSYSRSNEAHKAFRLRYS
jgi:hypothetical protein